MKTSQDPRHLRRRNSVKQLFAESFTHQSGFSDLTKRIIKDQTKLNALIKEAAPSWPIEKINRIDLAILHLSIFELLNEKTPPKVVIDEAVELAKEFGSEASGSFVNGVLGTIYEKVEEGEIKKNE